MELVIFVSLQALPNQPGGARQRPPIDLRHLLVGHRIHSGIEMRVLRILRVAQIPEHEPAGVSDLSIGLSHPVQELIENPKVLDVIYGADQEAGYLGATLLNQVIGVDAYPLGFGHGTPLLVQSPAMGYRTFVRRSLSQRNADKKRTLKPAAVLVSPLDVQVGRPGKVRPATQSREMAAPRVKPDVEDVELLAKLFPAALGAHGVRRKQVFSGAGVPGVRALSFEDGGHVIDHVLLEQDRITGVAVEGHNGNPPVALPGNTPVGTVLDHIGDPFLPPCGNPANSLDRVQDALSVAVGVERNEPLRRRPENDRIVAAPAVRIGVSKVLTMEKRARAPQMLHDFRIGFKHLLAAEELDVLLEPPLIIHRTEDLQPVLHTRHIIVVAVSGGRVHASGALVQRYVLAQNQERLAVD